jgi:hypothetical protein
MRALQIPIKYPKRIIPAMLHFDHVRILLRLDLNKSIVNVDPKRLLLAV